jgi:hypothetical protein
MGPPWAEVADIREPVSVGVVSCEALILAIIADPVPVCVVLVWICHGRADIEDVPDTVSIGVKTAECRVTAITDRVAVDIELSCIGGPAAVITGIRYAISISVAFAGWAGRGGAGVERALVASVSDPIRIRIELPRVAYFRAEVDIVSNQVAV